MRRILRKIILLSLLITLAGCSWKEQTKEEPKENQQLNTNTEINEDITKEPGMEASGTNVINQTNNKSSDTDYLTLSKEMAVQMVEGDFDTIYDALSPMVKLQMKKDDLIAAWDTTIASLGKYIKVLEQRQETSGQYQVVSVVLEFENNGLEISFTYNKLDQLDGLWFSYSPLEIGLEVNDDFEEIRITIGEENQYPVEGILTIPDGVMNPPVAILVPGSGNHDQDETIGPNKPFRDIAHGLARLGIATIRYQESFLVYDELKEQAFTIQIDSLNDVSKVINYAVNCNKVDTNRIFIIGHSLGGMMAPKIAADHQEVAGIICLAGSPRKLEDIIVSQQEYQFKISGTYDDVQSKVLMANAVEQANKVKNIKEGDKEAFFGIPASYWYSLNQIDIPEIADKLTIPIFIAQGSADWQVTPDLDYSEWVSLLAEKENVTFKLYDDLNHLFMTAKGKENDMTYSTKDTVSQQVIEDMASWIQKIN